MTAYDPRQRLITTKQASRIAGVTPAAVRTWKYLGRLDSHGNDPETGACLWLEWDILMLEAKTRRSRRGRPRLTGLQEPIVAA